MFFETFWLAVIAPANRQTEAGLASHIDHDADGEVAEARWFTQPELAGLKVFPARVKELNFEDLRGQDPFIGTVF